jgi:hypothetical protein
MTPSILIEAFLDFSQALIAEIVPEINPRPLPFTSFPFIH